MCKVVVGTIGAVTLLLAGMFTGNAEAAPLRGCCNVAGIWMCGMACGGPINQRLLLRGIQRVLPRGVASSMVDGSVPVPRHRTS
jgi:hypothetical protein